MAPGARSEFGAPMFEAEVLKKVLVTGASIRHSGNCAPLVTPLRAVDGLDSGGQHG